MKRLIRTAVMGGFLLLAMPVAAVPPVVEFNLLKPTNSGIPGEEVRLTRFAPDGRLWVAARWPFFQEGGVGIIDLATAITEPGSNFGTGIWTTWCDWDQPSPFNNPFINDINFEPGGVAWIATGGGLVRFDEAAGTWQRWDTSNSPLTFDTVTSVALDSRGHVWMTSDIPTSSNGALFEFDPVSETWNSYEVGKELPWELPWKSLTAVTVDANDHVWVGNETLPGVARFDGETWTLFGENVSQFASIIQDLDGAYWLLAGIMGPNSFYRFDGKTFTEFNSGNTPFVETTITTMAVDQDGRVFIGNWAGQVIVTTDSGETWQTFTIENNHVFGITPHPTSADVYINTPGAVRHHDGNGTWLRAFNTYNTGIPDNFIDRMFSDSMGNLWFTSGDGGASRWDGERWRNFGLHNATAEPMSHPGNEPADSVFEDSNGNIWIGGNGIARWDPKTGTFTGFWNWQNSSLGVDSFDAIAEDGNGDIWIGSRYTGVYRLDQEENNWESHLFGPTGSTANYVRDMERDVDGNLWVATQTSLHFFNGQTWFAVRGIHGSPVELPSQIEADPSGGMWIGASNGLIHYNDGEWFVIDQSNAPLPANYVHGLDVRDDGLVGFTVADFGSVTPFPNAVVLYDGKEFDLYSYEDSPLRHYQLENVAFDADGNFWVVTQSEGVAQLVFADATIPGDVDSDGDVDFDDFSELLASWGEPGCGGSLPCKADLDNDGDVDFDDFTTLLANWS